MNETSYLEEQVDADEHDAPEDGGLHRRFFREGFRLLRFGSGGGAGGGGRRGTGGGGGTLGVFNGMFKRG